MISLNLYIFAITCFTSEIYASKEKIEDMDLKCPAPQQKELKQMEGSYFLHFLFQLINLLYNCQYTMCMVVIKGYKNKILQAMGFGQATF